MKQQLWTLHEGDANPAVSTSQVLVSLEFLRPKSAATPTPTQVAQVKGRAGSCCQLPTNFKLIDTLIYTLQLATATLVGSQPLVTYTACLHTQPALKQHSLNPGITLLNSPHNSQQPVCLLLAALLPWLDQPHQPGNLQAPNHNLHRKAWDGRNASAATTAHSERQPGVDSTQHLQH
jgi:hypothetical protein